MCKTVETQGQALYLTVDTTHLGQPSGFLDCWSDGFGWNSLPDVLRDSECIFDILEFPLRQSVAS